MQRRLSPGIMGSREWADRWVVCGMGETRQTHTREKGMETKGEQNTRIERFMVVGPILANPNSALYIRQNKLKNPQWSETAANFHASSKQMTHKILTQV